MNTGTAEEFLQFMQQVGTLQQEAYHTLQSTQLICKLGFY